MEHDRALSRENKNAKTFPQSLFKRRQIDQAVNEVKQLLGNPLRKKGLLT